MGEYLPFVFLGTGWTISSLSSSFNYNHQCVLSNSGQMKCWGRNDEGQLGLGDDDNRGDDLGEMGDYLPEVNVGSGRTVTSTCSGLDHTVLISFLSCLFFLSISLSLSLVCPIG